MEQSRKTRENEGIVRQAAVRGILFDKDGTLFDYHGTWTPILTEAAEVVARGRRALVPDMLAAIGYEEDKGRFAAGSIAGAGDTFGLADAWLAIAGGWERGALITELDGVFAREAPLRSLPVTGLAAFFVGLKAKGFFLGIATNDGAASASATGVRFGFAASLDFSAGYDSGYGQKPGPGMALAFCAATGLVPGEVAVVGDNRHDLEMGRRAGAGLNIGVLTGTGGRADLEPLADHVIESITDLPALLDGLAR
ncbi:MAG: HAD family hydrolase [Parvibaculum sp.]|nr:HAD family hydrolase [Parvibaculum sp.]